MQRILIAGGGLAGCEAALQLAARSVPVTLLEMRPLVKTPAHITDRLAELVCSNSLKSMFVEKAQGLLKEELRLAGSFLLEAASETRVPAGKALAVDRARFADAVTRRVESSPFISAGRAELREIPDQGTLIIATGPLTSDALAEGIGELFGPEELYFFDAVSPIVDIGKLDWSRAFWGSRYGEGSDYINCVLDRDEFDEFASELARAERVAVKDFEPGRLFEGCLPIERMAERSPDSLRFGPMKPVGLVDPRTGRRPWAVVQLRRETAGGDFCNLVGFQTRLTYSEQKRVFGLVPALRRVEFERFGAMHRNTYINAPERLTPAGESRARPGLFFAGQITGVEGYVESIASGLVTALNALRRARGLEPDLVFPAVTMLGALQRYISTPDPDRKRFQPSSANFGMLPPLDAGKRRQDRRLMAERSLAELTDFMARNGIEPAHRIQ